MSTHNQSPKPNPPEPPKKKLPLRKVRKLLVLYECINVLLIFLIMFIDYYFQSELLVGICLVTFFVMAFYSVILVARIWVCPECGHTLDGGLFTIHNCPYCGADLDLRDEWDMSTKK